MTMDSLITKCLELLHYVPYIKEEKIKIQRFLSYLPTYFVNKIEYDTPKTLDEALYKGRLCYEHSQSRSENQDENRSIKRSFSEQRKKGYKPAIHKNQHIRFPANKNFENNKSTDKSEYQSNIPAQIGTKLVYITRNKSEYDDDDILIERLEYDDDDILIKRSEYDDDDVLI